MILSCPFCHVQVARDADTCPTCRRGMIRRCPHCSENISVLANLCKYCGEGVEPESAVVTAPPAPVVVGAAGPEVEFVDGVRQCAWEDPGRKGLFRRWWSTWSDSQFKAEEFWKKVPTEGGHFRAHHYSYFLFVQMVTFFLAFAVPIGVVIGLVAQAPIEAYAIGAAATVGIFPLGYVLVVVGNTVTALFWHMLLKVLGARGGFESTVRIVAYNSGSQVWGLAPGVGGLLGIFMSIWGHYHAFRWVHGLSKGRAVFAALIPLILSILLGLAWAAVVIALIAGQAAARC